MEFAPGSTCGFSLRARVQTMRLRQWTKNGLSSSPSCSATNCRIRRPGRRPWAPFDFFCLLSSSVYLINDVADAEKDRRHPTKCLRPIASGRLSVPAALVAAVALAALSLSASFALPRAFTALALGYFVLNLAYSFRLKQVVILDVLCVAIFFVLRAAAGVVLTSVEISHWLLICTILLALFIALSKRRHELTLLTGNAFRHRQSLGEYSPYLLDQMIVVVTASTLMAYILYTVDDRTMKTFGSERPCLHRPLRLVRHLPLPLSDPSEGSRWRSRPHHLLGQAVPREPAAGGRGGRTL